jgi:hypothetical protein
VQASRSAIRTGWVLLVISGGFWAFFFTAIPLEARAQQVFVPLGIRRHRVRAFDVERRFLRVVS